MKFLIPRHKLPSTRRNTGFALIATISVMVLLVMIALAMLSLSTIELRASQNGRAMAEAQGNARLALILAIGELQKEMGPDMRVSAEAAIFDQNPNTEAIEGVSTQHWLASYESWGSWLNASYQNPSSSETLNIQDTYTPKREKMFRRWLLSLPDGMSENINAPVNLSGWDDNNSVVLVGEGSLGDTARTNPEHITRAYLNSIGQTGRNASDRRIIRRESTWPSNPERSVPTAGKQPRATPLKSEWVLCQVSTLLIRMRTSATS
jgi:hypothetical protein